MSLKYVTVGRPASQRCSLCGCRHALVIVQLYRAGLPQDHKRSRQQEGTPGLLHTSAQTSAPEVQEALIRRQLQICTHPSGLRQPQWLHIVCVNKLATGLKSVAVKCGTMHCLHPGALECPVCTVFCTATLLHSYKTLQSYSSVAAVQKCKDNSTSAISYKTDRYPFVQNLT